MLHSTQISSSSKVRLTDWKNPPYYCKIRPIQCPKSSRNRKKLKGQNISISQILTKRMDKLKQAKEVFGFCNGWTHSGKILFKSDPNDRRQVYFESAKT